MLRPSRRGMVTTRPPWLRTNSLPGMVLGSESLPFTRTSGFRWRINNSGVSSYEQHNPIHARQSRQEVPPWLSVMIGRAKR